MFIGPVFSREAVTAPRRIKHYVARATYVSALLLLMGTAWAVLSGTQVLRNVGDLARFGTVVFQILAPLQLAMAVFFSALITASSVGQEKDRRTLLLLLMTDLSNAELVLGKLLASLLNVLMLIFAALPLFVGMTMLGGVEVSQVIQVFGVTVFSALVAGSLGSTLALWREKTFQTLALTVLVLVFWIGAGEVIAWLESAPAARVPAQLSVAVSPWRAVLQATRPSIGADGLATPLRPQSLFLLVALGLAALLNSIAIWKVRKWNPSRQLRSRVQVHERESIFSADLDADKQAATASTTDAAPVQAAVEPAKSRRVWNYPVLWREVCTAAYGRKTLVIRLAYAALVVAVFVGLSGGISIDAALLVTPLFLISLFLINAQAVTALSSERDGKTLDLLLVTDLSPKEFIFGKLFGVLYNTKEMVILPLLVCLYLWWRGSLLAENAFYLMGGLLVMDLFVAVLGIHCGLIHANSRVAVGTSLGTVFFLFVGIATCMRIMVAFSGSFGYQLAPFLAFMIGGGVGLYASLGARNASTAIFCASFACPFLTFWAITSFLQGETLGPFLVTMATYTFTTLTMLIPAIHEFDVASGRATED